MEAEKNKISTGTLTYEDIHNKAEYEADTKGVGIDTSKDAKKNEAGVPVNPGMPVEDKAESDTKATIAEGEIEIRDKDKQKQDLKYLNRDTKNSLNKLAEIFDRTKVEEKQEFAGLFQEVAHSYIGDMTGKISKEEKALLNIFVDGMVSKWSNGSFLAGASGTALLESMHKALETIKNPALRQLAAAMLGGVAGKIAGDNAQAGASSAVSTEKYNHLEHWQYEQMIQALQDAKDAGETKNIYVNYQELSDKQKQQWFEDHKKDEPAYRDADNKEVYIPVNVGVDISGNEVYFYPGPGEREFTIDKNLVATDLMKDKISSFDYRTLQDGEIYSVSQNISIGVATVEISLSITNTGDRYQDIKILGGADKNILSVISKLTSASFGTNYTEGTSKIYDSKNNIISNPETIRDTLTGTAFVAGGAMISAGKSVSLSPNGNMVVSDSVSNVGTTGIGGSLGISIGSYLGK